jgi:uncharacterized protein (UPF0335 family)
MTQEPVMTTREDVRYRDRIAEMLREIGDRREDIKEIYTEMRANGFTDIQIAGVRESAKRALWDQKKRARQEAIGQYVLQLEMPQHEVA